MEDFYLTRSDLEYNGILFSRGNEGGFKVARWKNRLSNKKRYYNDRKRWKRHKPPSKLLESNEFYVIKFNELRKS